MADHATCAPLTSASVAKAHAVIAKYIQRTPLLHSELISEIASSASPRELLGHPSPRFNLFFKCENFQRTGAFKARGAFHAVSHLIEQLGLETLQKRGIVTVSSGNHAQGLAAAGATFGVYAIIVMPRNSAKSKIDGVARTLGLGEIVFCGSTNQDKKAAAEQAIARTGAVFVPPYDHVDIILGQGTCAMEISEQFAAELQVEAESKVLDAVIAPIGGGGLLGGIATWFSDKPETQVFGAEPSFQGADDAARGLQQGSRIENVSSTTIADGLRTPVGLINWGIVSDKSKVNGVFAVEEDDIKKAMKLTFETLKIVVEPSSAVPLAVVLFNEDFRRAVAAQQATSGAESWNVTVVFSGGNTTVEAVASLFSSS
ncbi:threonine dehydratase [Xylariales sp. PMI_506]|nr:threonine dehydratase [Xylariales sp. PMI_506]